jgi:hypothetical protein
MIPQKKLSQLATRAIAECREWNGRHPVGAPVEVPGDPPFQTSTTGRAFELFGVAYVPIASQAAAAPLHQITPLEDLSHGD